MNEWTKCRPNVLLPNPAAVDRWSSWINTLMYDAIVFGLWGRRNPAAWQRSSTSSSEAEGTKVTVLCTSVCGLMVPVQRSIYFYCEFRREEIEWKTNDAVTVVSEYHREQWCYSAQSSWFTANVHYTWGTLPSRSLIPGLSKPFTMSNSLSWYVILNGQTVKRLHAHLRLQHLKPVWFRATVLASF